MWFDDIYIKRFQTGNSFVLCVCAWPFSIEVELVLTCSFSAGGHWGSMQSVANEDTAFFL